MDELKPCPFCGVQARWCGDDPQDPHECHMIHCDGCGMTFDVTTDEASRAETLEELKAIVAGVWNRRPGSA